MGIIIKGVGIIIKGIVVIERAATFPETRLRHFRYFRCLEGCRFDEEDSEDGLLPVSTVGLIGNRAKVVAPPQPTLARNLGHSPRECPTAQRQIQLNTSFFLYGEFKNFQQPPNSLDALNDS